MSRRLLPWTIALRPYCSLFSLFVVSEFALGYVTERSIPQVSLASLPDCLARFFFDSFLVVREEARTTPDRSVSRCYRCALRACGGCLAILDKGMRAIRMHKPPGAISPPENVGWTKPLSYDLNASTPLSILAIAPRGPVQTLHRTLTDNQFPQPSYLREALPAQPLASSISG
jgi:hypothetical protein